MSRLVSNSRTAGRVARAARMGNDLPIHPPSLTHPCEHEPIAEMEATENRRPLGDRDALADRTAEPAGSSLDFGPLRRVVTARFDHDTVGSDARPGRFLRHLAPEPKAQLLATHHHQSTLPGLLPPWMRRASHHHPRRILCSRPDRRDGDAPAHSGEAALSTRPVLRSVGSQAVPLPVPAVSHRLTFNRLISGTMVRGRRSLRSHEGLIGYDDGRWWGPTRSGEVSGIRDRAAANLTATTRICLRRSSARRRPPAIEPPTTSHENPQQPPRSVTKSLVGD
jgi:hypothetical protein